MPLKFGKAERSAILKLAEAEYDSDEAYADAILAAAVELVQGRAKFTVVGQCQDGPNRGAVTSLGLFSTEGEAKSASAALAFERNTEIHWATAVVPVHHMTAAKLHQMFAPEVKVSDREAEIRESVSAWQKQRECELLEWEASLSDEELDELERRVLAMTVEV